MKRSISNWTTALATAALIALPVAGAAQTPSSPQTPPQNPTQSPASPASASPQSTQPPEAAPATPTGQANREAAKQHLSEARDSLSQIASMPEAAKLQGEARTQVSQLIANFNELITTQSDWKTSCAKVEGTLNALLGSDNGGASAATPASPTGTTGTPGAAGTNGSATQEQIDPAIRAKLVEFRTHIKEFEQAAGGIAATGPTGTTPSPTSTPAEPTPSAQPASQATPTTATPAPTEPTTSAPPPTATPTPAAPSSPSPAEPAAPARPGTSATPGATGTSGTTGSMATNAGNPEVNQHLDAIATIIANAKDGKLDKKDTDQIKMHLDQLRQLLK
jgi:hypothetical protein